MKPNFHLLRIIMFKSDNISLDEPEKVTKTKREKDRPLTVIVKKVSYINADSGFCTFKVAKMGTKNPRNAINYTDNTSFVIPSEFNVKAEKLNEELIENIAINTTLILKGKFFSTEYGLQLECEDMGLAFPETDKEIENYLLSNRKIASVIDKKIANNIISASKMKQKSLNFILSSFQELKKLYIPALTEDKVLDLCYVWNYLRFESILVENLNDSLDIDIKEQDLRKIINFFVNESYLTENLYSISVEKGKDTSARNLSKDIILFRNVHLYNFVHSYFANKNEFGDNIPYKSSKKAFVFNQEYTNIFANNFSISIQNFIKKYPYFLTNAKGISFNFVDSLIKQLSIRYNIEERQNALCQFVVQSHLDKTGDTVIRAEELVELLLKFDTSITKEEAVSIIKRQIAEENLILRRFQNEQDKNIQNYITTKTIFKEELYIANSINEQINKPSIFTSNDIQRINFALGHQDCKLDDSQKEAVRSLFKRNFTIMTGGPGTGKTTTVQEVVNLIFNKLENPYRVSLCAPTGKAGKRLRETLGKTFQREFLSKQLTCSTIHLLMLKNEFHVHAKKTIYIVDESSMLDSNLFFNFIRFLDKKHKISNTDYALCLVGDIDQLPPVSKGQVMRDLIYSYKLKEDLGKKNFSLNVLRSTHRQSEKSLIAENARRINRKERPLESSNSLDNDDYVLIDVKTDGEILAKMKETVINLINSGRFKKEDIQIIVPQRSGDVGENSLNKEIRWFLNQHLSPIEAEKNKYKHQHIKNTEFLKGDRIICTKNFNFIGNKFEAKAEDEEGKFEIFNGELGHIINDPQLDSHGFEIDLFDRNITVTKDSQVKSYLQLGYAITIHKSQGSESPVILIPISNAHNYMLNKNLIYTGITRARNLVVIIGDKQLYHKILLKDENIFRKTGLAYELSIDKNEKRLEMLSNIDNNFILGGNGIIDAKKEVFYKRNFIVQVNKQYLPTDEDENEEVSYIDDKVESLIEGTLNDAPLQQEEALLSLEEDDLPF